MHQKASYDLEGRDKSLRPSGWWPKIVDELVDEWNEEILNTINPVKCAIQHYRVWHSGVMCRDHPYINSYSTAMKNSPLRSNLPSETVRRWWCRPLVCLSARRRGCAIPVRGRWQRDNSRPLESRRKWRRICKSSPGAGESMRSLWRSHGRLWEPRSGSGAEITRGRRGYGKRRQPGRKGKTRET